jgi:hypothetical protein
MTWGIFGVCVAFSVVVAVVLNLLFIGLGK